MFLSKDLFELNLFGDLSASYAWMVTSLPSLGTFLVIIF